MAKNTGIAQFSQGRSDVHRVSPNDLVITDGWNSRDETPELAEHIDMLAQSIAEIGVRKPIEVKLEDGRLVVKDGHCRTRAAMRAIEVYKADLKTVPVISVDRYANDADLILNQVISNSGKALTTIEEAKVYKKLLGLGWKQSDIAKKVGKSSGRISQVLSVLTLPAELQTAISSGVVSPAVAKAMADAETSGLNPEARQLMLQTAQSEGRKVRSADVSPTQGMTVKQAIDNSQVDCSEEIIDSTGMVFIKMPVEEWRWFAKTFKL